MADQINSLEDLKDAVSDDIAGVQGAAADEVAAEPGDSKIATP